eukprot:s3784_g2.t1
MACATWEAASCSPGSTLLVLAGPDALPDTLEEEPSLWHTAVRRAVEHDAKAARAAPGAVEAPAVALLLSESRDLDGLDALEQTLQLQMGLDLEVTEDLEGAGPSPIALLLVSGSKAAAAFGALRKPSARTHLRAGCPIVLLGLPETGLLCLHAEEVPILLFALHRDADGKQTLKLEKWDKARKAASVSEASTLRGVGLGSAGAAAVYLDGSLEMVGFPGVRLLPAEEEDKVKWELVQPDGNAVRLPRGFASGETPLAAAAEMLLVGQTLAFTGAGISKESGVPTYRDGDGLWKRYDAMEVSSISGLAGQPSKVWAFEREFYDILQRCQGPNPGHRALATLEADGCIDMVVTQNVDGFHQAAGSKEVVELHGSEVHAICLNKSCGHRVEMSRLFAQDAGELWEEAAWGLRWPEGPDDSDRQKAIRAQLTSLVEGKRAADDQSSASESSSDSSKASSDSTSSASSGKVRKRNSARKPKPLTEEERAAGPPVGKVPICPECKAGFLKPDGVREHYTLGNDELRCAILSDIYRDTLTSRERWAKSLGWGSAFPAVAEHIIPEGQPTPAAMADIRVDDPANAIPLFFLELVVIQAGHFAILPSGADLDDGVEFKVYVSMSMRRRATFYVKRTGDDREQLPQDRRVFVRKNGRQQELLLGDLDNRTFCYSFRGSMRSLYQKAVMAYGESQKKHRGGIPNPEETKYYERFLRHCTRLGSLLTRALVHPESQERER